MQTRFVNFRVFAFACAITVLVCSSLAGCATPGGSDPGLSERVEQDGYSFMPPDQDGWFIATRSASRIALAKAGKVEGQSYVIEASHVSLRTLTDPARLGEFVTDTNKRELPAPRFRVREHELSDISIGSAQCALTLLVAEDREPETGSNVVTAMIVESVSTVCIHPADARLGIRMTFSHRSFPEDRDRAFAAYAQSVLMTQQFTAINEQPGN